MIVDEIAAGTTLEDLSADGLVALALACGADDAGLVSLDDPALDEERPYILRAFPAARSLLSLVGRMHREPVRSPARSVANLEFHAAGHDIDEVARRIVRRLEDRGLRAMNPALGFPMEMEQFPERGWIVSHKRVAQAAGLGRMGIHRSLIHPKFGSFVLLGTVLIGEEVASKVRPLDTDPCLACKLCVAACPVGALHSDGYFDFSACLTHNYQQFMGGFVNFVEDVAASRSVRDFRSRHTYAETVTRWQSLAFGPNYNAAYCIAVCPAGEDVIGPYREDKRRHLREIVDPLTQKAETLYVTAAAMRPIMPGGASPTRPSAGSGRRRAPPRCAPFSAARRWASSPARRPGSMPSIISSSRARRPARRR